MHPWIDDEILSRATRRLKAGDAVHANVFYRFVEDAPETTQALHAFVATTWNQIGEGLKSDGLVLTRTKDPTGEPCYVAGKPGENVHVGWAIYRLW